MSYQPRDFARFLGICLIVILNASGVGAQERDTGSNDSLDPMVVRMFRVEHADPNAIATALSLFGSITPNRELGVITVRARASSVTAIEEALKVLDRPRGPALSVELTAHLLTASKNGNGKDGPLGNLENVARQLESSMGYTRFSVMETIVLRVSDRGEARTDGFLPAFVEAQDQTWFSFHVAGVQVGQGDEEGRTIRVERLKFQARIPVITRKGETTTSQNSDIGVNTTIEFREGQHAVVGKAISDGSDRSVFLIVSARIS
jgi:hypothetical protein